MTQENVTPPAAGAPLDYAAPSAGGYAGPATTPDDKNMGLLLYVLAIFTGFLGPLILWLVKKNDSPFIDDQGKEILNYQITTFIAILISIPLMFILIGFVLYIAVIVCYFIFMIMGAIKAKNGVAYRFPWALRLLK